ncbi:MAG: hypothetical protein QG635_370, partial [Bacteroidota bacterium]|nr:hypothetical protein [Bacteroidota bacterium]
HLVIQILAPHKDIYSNSYNRNEIVAKQKIKAKVKLPKPLIIIPVLPEGLEPSAH